LTEILIYLDNILICGRDHFEHMCLNAVLNQLQDFRLSLKKYKFQMFVVKYLRFVISSRDIKPDPRIYSVDTFNAVVVII